MGMIKLIKTSNTMKKNLFILLIVSTFIAGVCNAQSWEDFVRNFPKKKSSVEGDAWGHFKVDKVRYNTSY